VAEKINWFPGHMAKALREAEENLKLVDLVIELRDARIPRSSSNPSLLELLEEQERIIALTKIDLARPEETKKWLAYLEETTEESCRAALGINAVSGRGRDKLIKLIHRVRQSVNQKRQKKGLNQRPVRAMVAGVPNSGKSTLINLLAGGGRAKTGSRPGVTRGQQWIKVGDSIELLDTPGLLWPDITDKEMGYRLAICGSVNPDVVDRELLACRLLDYLREQAPGALKQRYGVADRGEHSYDMLAEIGRKRGCLQSGGRVDRQRASRIVLQEFQEGKLGRLTLEKPPQQTSQED